jgi:bla regulator protein BlaR1
VIGEITNHLWQTTIFAAAVGLFIVAFRKNRAQVRYWIWLSASLKFLIPFSLLANAGTRLWEALAPARNTNGLASAAISQAVTQITQPFSQTFVAGPSARFDHTTNWLLLAAFGLWISGMRGDAIAILVARSCRSACEPARAR